MGWCITNFNQKILLITKSSGKLWYLDAIASLGSDLAAFFKLSFFFDTMIIISSQGDLAEVGEAAPPASRAYFVALRVRGACSIFKLANKTFQNLAFGGVFP